MDNAEYGRNYYATHREEIAARVRNYYVNHREEKLEYAHNYRAAHREEIAECNHKRYATHREEILEHHRKWRAVHSDYFRDYYAAHPDYHRDWQKEYPEKCAAYRANRRAHKLGNGGTHTAADILAQYERQRGKCFWCGEKAGDSYHVDHVVPLVLGGSNGPENLVIACPSCNVSKQARHPMDFAGVMF